VSRFVLLAVLWFLLPSYLFGQSYSYQDTRLEGLYSIDDTAAQEIIQSIVRKLPQAQRELVEDIEVVWTSEPFNVIPSTSREQNGKRNIYISQIFAHGLHEYIQAVLVADLLEEPHFTEAWLEAFGLRLHSRVDWENSEIQSAMDPVSFAKMHPEDEQRFRSEMTTIVAVLYQSALVEIILHELGHHVEGAFYNEGATLAEANNAERLADDWANNAVTSWSEEMFGLTDHSSTLGRVFAIAYSVEALSLREASGLEAVKLATLRGRIETSEFASMCDLQRYVQEVGWVCDGLAEWFLAHLFVPKTRLHYLERADLGDAYALMKLGNFSWLAGELSAACNYYYEAWQRPYGDSVLSLRLARCYDLGLFSMPLELSRQSAANAFCAASEGGWLDARERLIDYEGLLEDPSSCY